MIQITTRAGENEPSKPWNDEKNSSNFNEFSGANHHYRPPGRLPPPRDSRKLLPFRGNPGVFSRPFQWTF
jgi:hypothetical protein